MVTKEQALSWWLYKDMRSNLDAVMVEELGVGFVEYRDKHKDDKLCLNHGLNAVALNHLQEERVSDYLKKLAKALQLIGIDD